MRWLSRNASIRSRVFVNSIPKSGTHLVASLLNALGFRYLKPTLARNLMHVDKVLFCCQDKCLVGVGQPQSVRSKTLQILLQFTPIGFYRLAHIPYQRCILNLLHQYQYNIIFVIRDPRDIIISQIFYYINTPKHYLHQYYRSLPTMQERILAAIYGIDTPTVKTFGIQQKFDIVWAWKSAPGVFTVRFEDIIGSQGGGESDLQIKTIIEMAAKLGISVNESDASMLGKAMFGKSRTFRKGQIGSWKMHFHPALIDQVKPVLNPLLLQTGYEPSWEVL